MTKIYKYSLLITVPIFLFFGYLFYRDIIQPSAAGIDGCTPNEYSFLMDGSDFSVSWTTRDECSGYLLYGESKDEINKIVFGDAGSQSSKEHSARVEGLSKDNEYYFTVVSDEKMYGENSEAILVRL